FALVLWFVDGTWCLGSADFSEIRTPAPPPEPCVNGPFVFGVRPGSPFLYRIPASGERPMKFSARGLPKELKLDSTTAQITGVSKKEGEHVVTLRAVNARGASEKKLRIDLAVTTVMPASA